MIYWLLIILIHPLTICYDLDDCRIDRMCECLPFGGSDCNLTNAPSDIPVAAYSSSIHVDVSVSKLLSYA